MRYGIAQFARQTAGCACALLVYAALNNKVRKAVDRMTARGDVYDKGYADGYDRAISESQRTRLRPVVLVPRQK